jgi:hypothetical protein
MPHSTIRIAKSKEVKIKRKFTIAGGDKKCKGNTELWYIKQLLGRHRWYDNIKIKIRETDFED